MVRIWGRRVISWLAHGPEVRVAILRQGPDLVLVLRELFIDNVGAVLSECLELVRRVVVAARSDCPQGGDQNLQGGHPLLTIDDVGGIQAFGSHRTLVDHHRSEKVGRIAEHSRPALALRLDVSGRSNDVAPEWRPVLRLIPHVGALKQRDLVDVVIREHLTQLHITCVHSTTSVPLVVSSSSIVKALPQDP